jgi:hypothetical protein
LYAHGSTEVLSSDLSRLNNSDVNDGIYVRYAGEYNDTNASVESYTFDKNNINVEEEKNAVTPLQKVPESKENTQIDFALWASVLLGCVTIIITLVSIILAIISIVGYRNFKKSIELTVQKISTVVAKEETTKQIDFVAKKELARLIDEGALTKHLESAVDMVYLRLRGRPEESKDGFNKYPELDDEEHDK